LLQNSATPRLYAHFELYSTRDVNTDNYTDYAPFLTQTVTIDLIEYRKKYVEKQTENLLFNEEDAKSANTTEGEKVNKTEEAKLPHLRNKIYIQFIHDTNAHHKGEFSQSIFFL